MPMIRHDFLGLLYPLAVYRVYVPFSLHLETVLMFDWQFNDLKRLLEDEQEISVVEIRVRTPEQKLLERGIVRDYRVLFGYAKESLANAISISVDSFPRCPYSQSRPA
jgi:hypothetical protein